MKDFGAEICSFGFHRSARSPTLVFHIEYFRGREMIRSVVPADCIDKRVWMETDAQVLRLLAKCL
jgi:hypothetical protein